MISHDFMSHLACGQTRQMSASNATAPLRAVSVGLVSGVTGPSLRRIAPMLSLAQSRMPRTSRRTSSNTAVSTKSAVIGGRAAVFVVPMICPFDSVNAICAAVNAQDTRAHSRHNLLMPRGAGLHGVAYTDHSANYFCGE